MSDLFLTPGTVKAGTTSITGYFQLNATTTGAGVPGKVAVDMIGSYWRQGGVRTAITLSNLAAVNSAYSAGGVKEVDATNFPGLYRFDYPDAAFATGADWVVLGIVVTGAQPVVLPYALPTYASLRDAIFAKVVETEGSITAQQALSVLLANLVGVTTSGGATQKTPNGVATRVAGTVNVANERTAVTLTPSA